MPLIPHQQRVHPILNVKAALKNGSNNTLSTERKPSRILQLRRAIRLDNIKNWFQQNLRNYCDTTSLHGISYMTRANISQNERIFWIIVVIVSIIVSIVLVIVSWMWNRETPTVTVIESSHFPTWNIPFPAVTICSFNKISKMKIMTLATKMQRPANVSMTKLLELLHITMYFSFSLNFSREDFDLVDNILQQNNYTVRQLGHELAPNCMDMITKCIWKGTNARCDSLFQRINTTEGVCCSFNYFGQPTNNFPAKIAYQVPKQPYRVTGCGYPTGLSVLLDTDPDDYFATYFNSFGFRLLIHDAYDFPDENAETKVVTLTRESFVRINPEATYATEDVKDMEPKVRNCLFANERRLKGMQRYSFVNCMSECRMELIFKRCGCIPVNLPNNGTYPICEAKRIYCVMKNRDIFIRALPNMATTLSMVKDTKEFPCNCMPDCESNNYPAEITMGHLNINAAHSNLLLNGSAPDALDNILLHVFFSDLMSTRYRMESFQNWLSALASFGGLLGLIMGFSIVTAFEFFYFLTFRPIFNYYSDS